jgi:CheY-like chemotaxis protein
MIPAAVDLPQPALKVAIFDDVVAARGEQFHIPGCAVDVYAHADDAVDVAVRGRYEVIFMDYAMGPGRKDGATATHELRAAGCRAKIIGISSDPAANAMMRTAGAEEALGSKSHLRSYLVHIGAAKLANS